MVYIGKNKYKLGYLVLSHMVADTIAELHEAAFMLDVNKKHFQDKPNQPHYDICQSKKKSAIESGFAKEVSDKEIVLLLKSKYGEKIK